MWVRVHAAQDITSTARIQCTECRNVDLCPQCAVLDTDAGEHRRSHAYRVMDNLGVSLDASYPDWTADEELRMLEGIQLFGFGNWKCVGWLCGALSPAVAPTGLVAAARGRSLTRPCPRLRTRPCPRLCTHNQPGRLLTTLAPSRLPR